MECLGDLAEKLLLVIIPWWNWPIASSVSGWSPERKIRPTVAASSLLYPRGRAAAHQLGAIAIDDLIAMKRSLDLLLRDLTDNSSLDKS